MHPTTEPTFPFPEPPGSVTRGPFRPHLERRLSAHQNRNLLGYLQVNYFGHAAVAGQRRAEPAFVFGAMLPDLAGMCRLPSPRPVSGALDDGIRFHHQTDSVFHQSRVFVAHNRVMLSTLREAGIRRGPARAAAHIGVEMLIDAGLSAQPTFVEAYLEGLRWCLSVPQDPRGLSEEERERLRSVCRHLLSRGTSVLSPSPDRLSFRLGRTLEARPRLSPTQRELSLIGPICAEQAERIEASLPELLSELSPLWKPSLVSECF